LPPKAFLANTTMTPRFVFILGYINTKEI